MADTYDSKGEKAAERADKGKLVTEAREFFKLVEEAESDIRAKALDDMKFRSGEQWPADIQQKRNLDGRPCLVINRIPQFIQQITNDQRQNRPSIKAHPVDSGGDPETAKTISGIIRHIEYNSNADAAYDTAFEGAVTGGFGYWRVLTEYLSPLSFDQEIKIKRIRNPFSVFFDPNAQEPDGSDASRALIVEDMSHDEYRARYGSSELAKTPSGEWEALGNQAPGWVSGKSCRVAEYFYKEYKEETLVLLDNGEVVFKRELEQVLQIKASQGAPARPVQERKTQVPVIKWCKLNGIEVLEETDWPGTWIPIIPVYGNELYIEGRRILEGVVRNAKDSQRMYNYWKSAQTEAIALAPRAPFVAAKGQIEGFEEDWATANTRNHSVLEYNPVDARGNPAPPPQRQAFEPAVQAITQAALQASEDLKATTGIYDAALGARANETSGIAIQRRTMQAQTSNFHLIDNLTRSLRHTGRILIDLIPKIYDNARAIRIVGEDGDQSVVKINQPTGEMGKDGKPLIYDLSAGKYDITVDVGPSYASKRQEASQAMLELSKSIPAIGQAAPDLILKSMDVPGAPEMAERLKKTLPPDLIDDPNQKQQPIPPQVQAQMQQMGQMVEGLTAKLNELQSEREQKLLELESKERIEFKKLEVQLEIKRAELDAKDSLALLNAEIKSIEQRLNLLNMAAPIEHDEPEQVPTQQPDGGIPPESDAAPQPTGGFSPGTPMSPEGI